MLDKLVPGMQYTRGQMQVAHMIHAVASFLMMAMFVGHIYMGTIGVKGSFQAMRTGYVDEAWAKEHHEYWYDDIKAGRVPAHRSAERARGGCRAAGADVIHLQRRPSMKPFLTAMLVLAALLGAAPASGQAAALSDEAKAKAAEAAAKAAHNGKVDAFQLCKSMDKVAADYQAAAKKAGSRDQAAGGHAALRRPRPVRLHARRTGAARRPPLPRPRQHPPPRRRRPRQLRRRSGRACRRR